jgi:hypothetical protein
MQFHSKIYQTDDILGTINDSSDRLNIKIKIGYSEKPCQLLEPKQIFKSEGERDLLMHQRELPKGKRRSCPCA